MPLSPELRQKWVFYTRETLINLVLLAFFTQAAWKFTEDYMDTGRVSSLLVIAFLSLLALFSLIRSYPKDVSFRFYDWIVALLGTGAAMLIQPAGVDQYFVAQLLQLVGILITTLGLASLNRSYATVPANRGVKTQGMFRFIRHPLYAGYILADIGMLINNPSWWNLCIVTVAVTCLVLRIFNEERFLLQDAAYQEFVTRTRYRLLPGVW